MVTPEEFIFVGAQGARPRPVTRKVHLRVTKNEKKRKRRKMDEKRGKRKKKKEREERRSKNGEA